MDETFPFNVLRCHRSMHVHRAQKVLYVCRLVGAAWGTCCNGQCIRQPPPWNRPFVWPQRALQAQTLQFVAVVRAPLSKGGLRLAHRCGCLGLASPCPFVRY